MRRFLNILKTMLADKLMIHRKQCIKSNSTVNIEQFDSVKHSLDFFILYPEYAKDSNIETVPFGQYYWKLLNDIQTGQVVVFTVLSANTGNVIGFIVGEEVYSFIVNAHIIIYPQYRNFYNAYNASKLAINKMFDCKCRQIIAEVSKTNKNVKILLKKLGFELWGISEDSEVYSMINTKERR